MRIVKFRRNFKFGYLQSYEHYSGYLIGFSRTEGKGIRDNKDFGSAMNQKLHAWQFYRIVQMLKYKGENCGVNVVEVSEKNTSKTCCICGHLNTKSARHVRGELHCKNCESRINADVNGAFNILNKYLPTLGNETSGVVAGLHCQPSPIVPAWQSANRGSQITPTFVARIDLRNYQVEIRRCGREKSSVTGAFSATLDGVTLDTLTNVRV